MRNKISIYILVMMVLVSSMAVVSAERFEKNIFKYGILNDDNTLTLTDQEINNVNVIGFVCADSNCKDVSGRLWGGQTLTSQGSEIVLEYPEELQSAHGYGIFMFKEGYFPYEIRANYSGQSDDDPQGPFTNLLTKKQTCYANITDLTVHQREGILSVDFQIANTSFNLISPVDYNKGIVEYNPAELKSLLSVDVDVKVKVMKDGQLYEERLVRNMNPSEKIGESFEFTVSPGNYTVEVTSIPEDSKCLSVQERKEREEISIIGVEIPANASSPLIRILSPESGRIYNTSKILLDIETENATEVWYSINNGANIIYGGAEEISFPSGEVFLRAFAINEQGVLANASVTFNVVIPIPGDVTPPAPITNLTLSSRTESALAWSWINPSDSDFDHVLVSIDGLDTIIVRGNSYTAEGLEADTSYTITVYTVDTSGNVNPNGVSRTDTTLRREVVVGDDDDGDNDFDRIRFIEDELLEEELSYEPVTAPYRKKKISLDTNKTQYNENNGFSLNTLSIILLIGSFILLVVILIVALSKLSH